MTRVWRLRPGSEFERVRQNGRTWPHRFFVLIVRPCPDRPEARPRCGVAVGKKLGDAVTRNRLKRRLREAVRQIYPHLPPGIDVILIARAPLEEAAVSEIAGALTSVLQRAQLWQDTTSLENR
jgi:ribonuclease P protein component